MIAIHLGKRVFERPSRTLGGVALSPIVATQCPSELESRPTLGIHESNSSDQITAAFFFNRPNAITAKVPVTHDCGHLPPDFDIRHWPSVAQKAHHLRIGRDLCVRSEIIFAKPTHQQTLCL